MTLMNLLFGSTTTMVGNSEIGAIELDALLSEKTTLSAQITEYPVEDGTVISDHITLASEQLEIEGVITGAGTLFNIGLGKTKMMIAKLTLRQLYEERALLSVVTGLDVYEDFALESCDISRDNESGEQFNVSLVLRKITKATLRVEEMPPEKAGSDTKGKAGSSKKSTGKVKTSTPTTTTSSASSSSSTASKVPAKKTTLGGWAGSYAK